MRNKSDKINKDFFPVILFYAFFTLSLILFFSFSSEIGTTQAFDPDIQTATAEAKASQTAVAAQATATAATLQTEIAKANGGNAVPPTPNMIVYSIFGTINLGNSAGYGTYINAIVDWLTGLSASVSVLMIMIGGIQYMMAGANEKAITAAKERIQFAIYGLIIITCAFVLIQFIFGTDALTTTR
ncbi:MAG: pilin [bacterium]